MQPVKLRDNIYWVGAIDWNLRTFHGYTTQRGTTYNAYLVIDDKITLIDTVKHYLYDEMLERIRTIIDPARIDYIVSNHVEMDHSGSLPFMHAAAPKATIITSPAGAKGLARHFGDSLPLQTVKTGDCINIGKRTLTFVQTPMVHWPDNMVTYCPEERLLFSNDAFGQHIATPYRFDDEGPRDIHLEEARKYYANIVLPYDGPVRKALETAAGLQIDMIAPSHGIIWRTHIPAIVADYGKWSTNTTEPKASIIYDTMWHSTEKIAHAVADGFGRQGIPSRMFHLENTHISDIMTDVITSRYICVGSSTLNSGMLPSAAAFLAYMQGLAPKKRVGMAFGSYGWGGQSVGLIEEILKGCGFDMLTQVRIQYTPDMNDLAAVRDQVATGLKAKGVQHGPGQVRKNH